MWIGRILLLGVGSSYLPRWVLSPLRHRDYVAGRLKALRKTTRWRQPNQGIRRGQGDEAKDRARQHGPVVVEAEGNDGLKFEDLDRAIGLRRWIHGLGSPLRVKDVIGLAFSRSELEEGDTGDEGQKMLRQAIAVTDVMAKRLTRHFQFSMPEQECMTSPVFWGGSASDGSIVGVLSGWYNG